MKLSIVCARCAAENAPAHKFCEQCGQSLGPVSGAPPTATRFASPDTYTPRHLAEKILTSKSALEGERKQVTVLFADLKGSMELLAERDPEEARTLLDAVLEVMMDAVHRYEGTVNQVMGDGIMALFGAPLAHEDHAVRACHAALRMQESVKRYADTLQREAGVRISIRVGVNSGEVVVRSIRNDLHTDYTAVGQTTHLAARLEQMAQPGSILIACETVRLAEGYIQVTSLGPTGVKGLSEPVEVYELTGAGIARTRLQVSAARGLSRFVGRDAEIETLRRASEEAGHGRGQVVGVVGEPGVGKSRLFWEFTHSPATDGWLVLESPSVSYGKATPYLPVIDLLKSYFKIEDQDAHREIHEKVSAKLLMLDDALKPALVPCLALFDVPIADRDWQGLDPRQRRQHTLDAVGRLLFRESQVQPLALVFEDLHAIDAETQVVLDTLVEGLPAARVLLLVNYRPDFRHGWGSKTYYMQLRIDPLSWGRAEELLRACLGEDASLDALKQLLIERTEGNPFFLEESVRALVETKVLVGDRRGYRAAKPIEAIRVPGTVQAVLATRIDRLPSEDRRLLQSAAVVGKDVPFALLNAIAELPDETLRHSLARLRAAEFLYETSRYPDVEYTFKHALTHDVAYGSLLHERRRALHVQIVDAIERLYPDRLIDHVERLAHHAVQGEDHPRAVRYLLQAGKRAAARSTLPQAMRHLGKGLELLRMLPEGPERDRQELALQTAIGITARASKGSAAPETEHAFARARELCGRVRDFPQLGPVLVGQWSFYLLKAQYQTARALAEELRVLAERDHDPLLGAVTHRVFGMTAVHEGDFVAARMHLEQGAALYRPEEHQAQALRDYGIDPRVSCLAYLGRALWSLGYPDQALARNREAVVQAQERGGALDVAVALAMLTSVHQLRRDLPETRAATETALTYATKQGVSYWLARNSLLLSWAHAMDAPRAERETRIADIRRSLDQYRATGTTLGLSWFLALLAQMYGAGEQASEGLTVLDAAQAHVDETGEGYHAAEIHCLKGELLLMRGGAHAPSAAEASFRRALEIARDQQAKAWELRIATSLARLLHQMGAGVEARELLGPVYAWFTEGFDTADLRDARAVLQEIGAQG